MLLVPSFKSHLSSTCWSSVLCDKDPMPKSGPHSYAFFWRPPSYQTLIKDPIWSFWHAKYSSSIMGLGVEEQYWCAILTITSLNTASKIRLSSTNKRSIYSRSPS